MTKIRPRVVSTLVAVAAGYALAAPALAGGLLIPGAGSSAQPRAGAFVAKADDPTALFHNPAGVAKQDGTAVHMGANFLDFSQSFVRDGAYEVSPDARDFEGDPYPRVRDRSRPEVGVGGFQALPIIAVTSDLGTQGRFRFAAGSFVPNAYPAREYEPGYQFEDPEVGPPPQRYDVMSQEVFAAFPSIAVAARVTDQLDLGMRLSYGFASVAATTYVWGLRNYEEATSSDAVFSIDVSDPLLHGAVNAFGAGIPMPLVGLGALYRPSSAIELGLSYRNATVISARGRGSAELGEGLGVPGVPATIEPEIDAPQCEGGGTPDNIKACLRLELPQSATLGARYVFRNALGDEVGDVELDVQWEDWSNSTDFEVVVDGRAPVGQLNLSRIRHGFRDTVSVRLGGAYSFALGQSAIIARAGAAYDSAAAPNSWTRLDLDGFERVTLGTGIGYQVGNMRVDLGGGVVLEPERVVAGGCNPSVDAPGCDGERDAPAKDRTAPDPVQPLFSVNNQFESPFNDGRYKQRYIHFSLGVTRWF